jgi:hypothetical protein
MCEWAAALFKDVHQFTDGATYRLREKVYEAMDYIQHSDLEFKNLPLFTPKGRAELSDLLRGSIQPQIPKTDCEDSRNLQNDFLILQREVNTINWRDTFGAIEHLRINFAHYELRSLTGEAHTYFNRPALYSAIAFAVYVHEIAMKN